MQVDAEELAAATEGFVGRDLYIVVQRVLHATISRHLDVDVERKLTAINDDFVNALKAYVPLALQGIALHKSDTKWCDIGGLEEVRSALIETLELPTKFAALFEQVPLKLRSGLLLYGPPGCGKTLLASAVARECGLNFISVKVDDVIAFSLIIIVVSSGTGALEQVHRRQRTSGARRVRTRGGCGALCALLRRVRRHRASSWRRQHWCHRPRRQPGST